MTGPFDDVVAVFGASGSVPGDGRYEEGERCGRLLASAGLGVMTGGYGGIMEAVSKGASSMGGRVIGVTAPTVFPQRSGGNRYLDEEIPATSLTDRLHVLIERSSASIILSGSLGTATELMVAWNVAFVTGISGGTPKPVAIVGSEWSQVVSDLAVRLETDRSLVSEFSDVPSAVDHVTRALRVG